MSRVPSGEVAEQGLRARSPRFLNIMEDDWILKGFKGRQMVRFKSVDTPSGSCGEGRLERVKLEVEPGEEAVGVIQMRRCSEVEGSKGRYLRIKRQDLGSIWILRQETSGPKAFSAE